MAAASNHATKLKSPQYQDLEYMNNLEKVVDAMQLAVAVGPHPSLSRDDTRANIVAGYIASIITEFRAVFPKEEADKIADERITTILLQYPNALASYKRYAELENKPFILARCQELEMKLAERKLTHLNKSGDSKSKTDATSAKKTDTAAPTSGLCAYREICGNLKEVVARCSRCRIVFYCGPGCQKADWKSHKKVCK